MRWLLWLLTHKSKFELDLATPQVFTTTSSRQVCFLQAVGYIPGSGTGLRTELLAILKKETLESKKKKTTKVTDYYKWETFGRLLSFC